MNNGITFVSNYSNVSVGTAATLISASNPLRKGLMVFNNSVQTVYIGMDPNVTSSNGFPLQPNCTFATNDLAGVWKGSVYGISTAPSDTRYWEFGP
jgi:hypothetical protein